MNRLPMMILVVAFTASLAIAGSICPGDATGDDIVDVDDLTTVILSWGAADVSGDVTGDGVVDIDDLTSVILNWGCDAAGGSLPTLSGTVTNLWTGDPVANAAVEVGGDVLFTDELGMYTGEFPAGGYIVTVEAQHFTAVTGDIILFPDMAATFDAELEPVAAVVVTISTVGDAEPGASVTAMAEVEVLDGSSIEGYAWTQIEGPDAVISNADTDTALVDLADSGDYKAQLIEVLSEPPIGPEQLPPNVPLPPEPFPGGLQDRFQIVGVNPFSLEEAGLVGLSVDVTTTSGVYTAHDDVETHLPWRPATGLRNVALELRVLLHGKTQGAYDWALSRPNNSSAMLIDADTQNPEFTPDWPGVYELTVTDEATASTISTLIYGGSWRGVVVGEDEDGRPISDPSCTGCHSTLNKDKFAPWAQTGHAEIFTNNLNSSPYWGPQCFDCHTVGYDLDAANNGIDDAFDYDAFLDAGLIGNPSPDNWSTMLADYSSSAKRANVQCENCHGPQWSFQGTNSNAHSPANPPGEPRVSLSSDVCATCHGEPLRHARYQQWQLSAHANYDVAIDEGESGNCSRCHTANGFLTWLPILLGEEPGDPLASIEVTWTPDETHPQTCVTCHDPHNIGTTSGIDTNATVRISGETPPLIAGFTAYGVGRGAICMTCHNSRRGLHNDDTFDEIFGTSDATRAPHGSAQADVLMGENAYLMPTGFRGNHSFIEDACVGCHMEETAPPDDLSYNQGGTNHTFFASIDICANCHDEVDGETIQAGVQGTLDALQDSIEDALLALITTQTEAGNVIDLNGAAQITDAADVQDIVFGEYHGRQAMTVTFTDDTTVGPVTMNSVDVLDGAMQVLGILYDFASPALVKAGWNWALVHNDGSLGVHNPSFASDAMTMALTALEAEAAMAPAEQVVIDGESALSGRSPVSRKR